ncbi:MAG TPA: hypothetical protein VEW03_03390 [Longimicrobiaceae bacterium]|nr:hypothetical protein [Longimicrobiaceae bacterium]
MRLTRLFPACAAVLVLAACGGDPITAPGAPDAPRFERAPRGGGVGLQGTVTATVGETECTGTIVLTTHPDGTTTLECQTDQSKQDGSGG